MRQPPHADAAHEPRVDQRGGGLHGGDHREVERERRAEAVHRSLENLLRRADIAHHAAEQHADRGRIAEGLACRHRGDDGAADARRATAACDIRDAASPACAARTTGHRDAEQQHGAEDQMPIADREQPVPTAGAITGAMRNAIMASDITRAISQPR